MREDYRRVFRIARTAQHKIAKRQTFPKAYVDLEITLSHRCEPNEPPYFSNFATYIDLRQALFCKHCGGRID